MVPRTDSHLLVGEPSGDAVVAPQKHVRDGEGGASAASVQPEEGASGGGWRSEAEVRSHPARRALGKWWGRVARERRRGQLLRGCGCDPNRPMGIN
jgi:hypothetical protein